MLKAAVVGAGSMGRNHARVYKDLGGVELAAVLDIHEPTARSVGERFGVPGYTSLQTMLDEVKLDLASVAVPTVYHHAVALELISRGINVLVEKPITSTVEEGRELVEAAKARSIVLAVGHIERFNPVVAELRRRLSEGMAGRIYQINAQRLSPYPTRIRDAGVVIDLASHDIDLVRHLVRSPIARVYGETLQSINSDREDLFHGSVRFTNGVLGTLDVNWMTPKKVRRLTITGARGFFDCDLLSQELFFYENESAPSQWDQLSMLRGVAEGNILGIRIARQEPLVAELKDFVDAVSQQRAPIVTAEDALTTLEVALEFMGAAGRREVRVFDTAAT